MKPPLTLADFPSEIQPFASRDERFWGRGTPDCPHVGGWIVQGEVAAYHDARKAWLKAHGFIHKGRRWFRADQD
jgi:hypothetical protein